MQGAEPIDQRLFGRTGVFALLLIALICEGYDLQAANFAAPDLVRAMGVTRAEIGPLLSASLFGVLIGAIGIGSLGDRFGRKRLIVGACAFYGLFSLIASQAETLPQLIALRFLIGLGLGAVLPNALALAGEIARPGREATATALVGIGITLGGVVAGAVAAALLPAYGWPSLFLVGGILPLVIALLLQIGLPESPAFLAQRAAGQGAAPRATPGPMPLLQGELRWVTLGIWLVFASVLMVVYLLSGWIPLLLGESGFSPPQAALIGSAYHAGGVAGGVVASLILRKRGWNAVAGFALGACAFLLLLVLGAGSTALLVAGVIAAGFCVTGTQNAINGAAGVTYPTALRARGLGWALGIGRVGSIAGPLVGSAALWLGMSGAHQFFALPLIPLALAAAIALRLRRTA